MNVWEATENSFSFSKILWYISNGSIDDGSNLILSSDHFRIPPQATVWY